nr:serine/arginine repetitive matrix protein 1-like [Symphalangus syndactylus]
MKNSGKKSSNCLTGIQVPPGPRERTKGGGGGDTEARKKGAPPLSPGRASSGLREWPVSPAARAPLSTRATPLTPGLGDGGGKVELITRDRCRTRPEWPFGPCPPLTRLGRLRASPQAPEVPRVRSRQPARTYLSRRKPRRRHRSHRPRPRCLPCRPGPPGHRAAGQLCRRPRRAPTPAATPVLPFICGSRCHKMALREETRPRHPAPPRRTAPLRPAPPHSRSERAAGQRHCLPPPASLPAPPCSHSGPLTEESPFRRGCSHSPAAKPRQERKGEGREAAGLARSGPRGAVG